MKIRKDYVGFLVSGSPRPSIPLAASSSKPAPAAAKRGCWRRASCALLGGVAPGEILAITFTRKAAREIEERVVDWLHFLATGDETQVDFLAERGVVADSLLRARRADCTSVFCGAVGTGG